MEFRLVPEVGGYGAGIGMLFAWKNLDIFQDVFLFIQLEHLSHFAVAFFCASLFMFVYNKTGYQNSQENTCTKYHLMVYYKSPGKKALEPENREVKRKWLKNHSGKRQRIFTRPK